jgi:Uma2 family endonuclease
MNFPTPITPLPPLENGDKLSRDEFERRYNAMPHLNKAELVEGIVYLASPLHFESHGQPHGFILTWLGTYCAATPRVYFADNATVRLDTNTEVQPDALLFLPSTQGGRCHISEDDFLVGSPELIIEVAASSASYDLHSKRQVYQRCGVLEYLIWVVYEQRFEWLQLQQGQYLPLQPDARGLLHSQIFPGLVLAVAALLTRNLAQVLAELQKGLQTTEHTAFVEQLSK